MYMPSILQEGEMAACTAVAITYNIQCTCTYHANTAYITGHADMLLLLQEGDIAIACNVCNMQYVL